MQKASRLTAKVSKVFKPAKDKSEISTFRRLLDQDKIKHHWENVRETVLKTSASVYDGRGDLQRFDIFSRQFENPPEALVHIHNAFVYIINSRREESVAALSAVPKKKLKVNAFIGIIKKRVGHSSSISELTKELETLEATLNDKTRNDFGKDSNDARYEQEDEQFRREYPI